MPDGLFCAANHARHQHQTENNYDKKRIPVHLYNLPDQFSVPAAASGIFVRPYRTGLEKLRTM